MGWASGDLRISGAWFEASGGALVSGVSPHSSWVLVLVQLCIRPVDYASCGVFRAREIDGRFLSCLEGVG